jgi:Tfp pilus assembly pilus retraction ATPase PilT
MGSLLEKITDIHIKVLVLDSGEIDVDYGTTLIFPNIRPPETEEEKNICHALLKSCVANNYKTDDFLVVHRGTMFRCRRDRFAIDGEWYRLRRLTQAPPSLDSLPTPLPGHIVSALMSSDLCGGGLVLVVGGPGSGKTTTASAIVVSRLREYGGMAYTVEDPPELPLNGRHGEGYCTQTVVPGDDARDWGEALRGVLRSQPVGSRLMLFVGELRDAVPAMVMLRAASNGFLTIATAFGADIISGIDALFQLVGNEYAVTIANVLRCVVFQRLVEGRLQAECLVSDGPSSRTAVVIRNKMLSQLKDEIVYQRNLAITQKVKFMQR